MREKIENEQLIKRILRCLNKADIEDFNEEDLARIENISFSHRLVNGRETGIKIEDIKFFQNLKSLTLKGYFISNSDLQRISQLSTLENLSFVACEFQDTDFEKVQRLPNNLKFSYCSKLPSRFPKVDVVNIDFCEINLDSIDLSQVIFLNIQNSEIKNAHDVGEYENIREVNFDGSYLINPNGNYIKDIKVGEDCIYSHKERETCFVDDKIVFHSEKIKDTNKDEDELEI